jgi:hypothetical protein
MTQPLIVDTHASSSCSRTPVGADVRQRQVVVSATRQALPLLTVTADRS